MSGMDKTLFNMRFTSKQLQRESAKAANKAKAEDKKVVEAIKKGDNEMVKILCGNAIREKNQATNFMRLASRIDAVAGRCVVRALVAPREGTGSRRRGRERACVCATGARAHARARAAAARE